jgi:hypothetical protein
MALSMQLYAKLACWDSSPTESRKRMINFSINIYIETYIIEPKHISWMHDVGVRGAIFDKNKIMRICAEIVAHVQPKTVDQN